MSSNVVAFPCKQEGRLQPAAVGRVRRRDEVPEHIESETHRTFPYRLACDLIGYEVRYRRGRWTRLSDDPAEETAAEIRETFAWIEKDGERVGAVGFREIRPTPFHDPDEFVDMMDYEDADLGGVAGALTTAWPNLEVARFGPILELTYVWATSRRSGRGVCKTVARALLERLLPRCAILFSYAIALEYLDDEVDRDKTRAGLDRRRAAMMRLAFRELGLKPLPGEYGDEGYLWRTRPGLEKLIPAPRGAASRA